MLAAAASDVMETTNPARAVMFMPPALTVYCMTTDHAQRDLYGTTLPKSASLNQKLAVRYNFMFLETNLTYHFINLNIYFKVTEII